MVRDFDFTPVRRKVVRRPVTVKRPVPNLPAGRAGNDFVGGRRTERPIARPSSANSATRSPATVPRLQQKSPSQSVAPPAAAEKQEVKTSKRRYVLLALLGVLGVAALVSGFFIPALQNPHMIVVAYVIIALIFRLKSKVSFSLAFLLLLFIPVLLALDQQGLAQLYAVFSFYFLAVGLAFALLELKS